MRGRRLAFIEVKYRTATTDPGAVVSARQSARFARAAEHWAWKHALYRGYRFGLDVMVLAPWRPPRHLIDGLQPL